MIQTEEVPQRLALVEGKCRLGLSAMEVCEWVAGMHTYVAAVAYGSCHTLGPLYRKKRSYVTQYTLTLLHRNKIV